MIKLVRFDLDLSERNCDIYYSDNSITFPKPEFEDTITRQSIISKFELPEDSVIKIFSEGKLIPWSEVGKRSKVELHVVRPNQNVKPGSRSQYKGQSSQRELMVRKKVKELEGRIASLEAVADPAIISAKTERDLQLLTKQISFLAKRLDEADQAKWIKKT